jgi:UDP-N-acetyl-D-glucosamine dehydrogenase
MEKLEELGAAVSYNDPYIPEIRPSREYAHFAGRKSAEISNGFDLILIATAHDSYRGINFPALGVPIVDTRNLSSAANGLRYSA